jgi:hypothetical protein
LDWWTHGRLVNYNQPNPAQNDISNWLRENPHRINLATIGFAFGAETVTEAVLKDKFQVLDMWTGKINSTFVYNGSTVVVETSADSDSDTVAIGVQSDLLNTGSLQIFFDFPYPTKDKFNAPFVGVFNATDQHQTSLQSNGKKAVIRHDMGATGYNLNLQWDVDAQVSGPTPGTHRYTLKSTNSTRIQLVVNFSPLKGSPYPTYESVTEASTKWWRNYWSSGAFVDLTGVANPKATEIQRRIIQSQYLVAVNSASSLPPQGELITVSPLGA